MALRVQPHGRKEALSPLKGEMIACPQERLHRWREVQVKYKLSCLQTRSQAVFL